MSADEEIIPEQISDLEKDQQSVWDEEEKNSSLQTEARRVNATIGGILPWLSVCPAELVFQLQEKRGDNDNDSNEEEVA